MLCAAMATAVCCYGDCCVLVWRLAVCCYDDWAVCWYGDWTVCWYGDWCVLVWRLGRVLVWRLGRVLVWRLDCLLVWRLVLFLTGTARILLQQKVQTAFGAHPAPSPVGARSSFPEVKRPRRTFDCSPSFSADVKNEWSCTSAASYLDGLPRDSLHFILLMPDENAGTAQL